MRVVRWGKSLAVRLPATMVAALCLEAGDDVELQITRRPADSSERAREQAPAWIRALRRPLPPGWKFDREDN